MLISLASPGSALAAASAQVGACDGRLWAALPDDDLVDGVAAIQQLSSRLVALQAELLAEVDTRDLARRRLHWASTSDWFTHLAGTTRREGRRTVAHARLLVGERFATLDALRTGSISPCQSAIVCDAVEALPGDRDLRARGEQVLIQEAGRLDATDLARTGRHLTHVVDPDRTEARLEAELAREDRAAHAGRFLAITDDGAGGIRLRGRGAVEDAAILRAALLPLTRPEPTAAHGDTRDAGDRTGEPDPRDHGARTWDALVQVAQHSLDTDLQPASHGARPRVSVLLDWSLLHDGAAGAAGALGEAVTDDGLRLAATAVRRLACDADVIPICLGSEGEVLDVGRTHRLVTAGQWRALVARDRHCTFPGCTRPPVMCHAHHVRHWADGGPTSLDNLALLCGAHHRVVHDTPWQVRSSSLDRRPEFLPPPRATRGPPDTWIRHRPRPAPPGEVRCRTDDTS